MTFRSAAIAIAGMSSLSLMPAPAAAYDPCERALRDVQEAEADWKRWYNNHCRKPGVCVHTPRSLVLLERLNVTRARQAKMCG